MPSNRLAGYVRLGAVVAGCVERNDRKIVCAGRETTDDIRGFRGLQNRDGRRPHTRAGSVVDVVSSKVSCRGSIGVYSGLGPRQIGGARCRAGGRARRRRLDGNCERTYRRATAAIASGNGDARGGTHVGYGGRPG